MEKLLTEILIPLFSPIINFCIYKRQFKVFKNTEAYKYFDRIIEIINYDTGRFVLPKNNDVPKNTIDYFIANELIKKKDGHHNLHEFTKKGHYFAKLYLDENNN